jgi:hypothetical protein
MKVFPLAFIWCISIIMSSITIDSLSYLFWLSFTSFVICSLYMEINKERLLREIDNKFGQ